MTEPSQGAEPLPRRDPLPRRGDPLPRREPLPQREMAAQRGEPSQQRGEPFPQRGETLPPRGGVRPQREPLAQRMADPLPQRMPDPLLQRTAESLRHMPDPLPASPPQVQRGDALPQREPLPRRGDPLPRRGEPLPQRGEPLPQRAGALPRRTTRTRRSGRHRSPDRLSLPSDAPTLVLVVPGSASTAIDQVAEEIATSARVSCAGADVRVAYLEGSDRCLDDVLSDPAQSPWSALAVLVPLLAGPHPAVDAAVERAVAGASADVMVAEHLGPHPLLAEALHARLADAGLARASRARGLNIITTANGVLVLADRGEDAARAAGVAAVLLAGRLAAPAFHASIDDPEGINSAVAQLRATGATRIAIAPCVIGPEADLREVEAISIRTGAVAAPPLGAHPAIAQLVAMRYGEALANLRPADSVG